MRAGHPLGFNVPLEVIVGFSCRVWDEGDWPAVCPLPVRADSVRLFRNLFTRVASTLVPPTGAPVVVKQSEPAPMDNARLSPCSGH